MNKRTEIENKYEALVQAANFYNNECPTAEDRRDAYNKFDAISRDIISLLNGKVFVSRTGACLIPLQVEEGECLEIMGIYDEY